MLQNFVLWAAFDFIKSKKKASTNPEAPFYGIAIGPEGGFWKMKVLKFYAQTKLADNQPTRKHRIS